MKIFRIVIAMIAVASLSMPLVANNVKITGDIKVTPTEIEGTIAPFGFTVDWENSWRDEFNHDAVYVFLKYKLDSDALTEWHHLFLTNEITVTGAGESRDQEFEYELLNPTGAGDKNVGLLIWRKKPGFGPVSVNVNVKWNITSNSDSPLTSDHFNAGQVFMSAMAIEMVHIPQVAFKVGDSKQQNPVDSLRFRHKHMSIPAKWDIMSDEYEIYTKDNVRTEGFLPEYAVNKMNDTDRSNRTNAWVGNKDVNQFWRIDFGKRNGVETSEKKKIRYFAIEGVAGYVPASWQLVGRNSLGGNNPDVLYKGTAADWVTTSSRVYPANKALKVDLTNFTPDGYRYYELQILDLGVATAPAIKTIAMCEEDLAASYDNSVLIQENVLHLTDRVDATRDQVYAGGGVTGDVSTTAAYPSGFSGFFAMKYEVSQEQYVAFLNKLNLSQQNIRTVGEKLVDMKVGEYVFGGKITEATARNGIVLAARNEINEPVVFTNNLNKESVFAQDGDGQTLACNFLTPADMLAYADWIGLRPLSEMEYEKMTRQPYPAIPPKGVYAWSSTDFVAPGDIVNPGSRSESLSAGNANGGKQLEGPVRCGAFSKSANSQQKSGVSFWGITDLSGNLAEIYYNLNAEGRVFGGLPRTSHGDGTIHKIQGDANVPNSLWPTNALAFALRGGSFSSEKSELEVSDRSKARSQYTGAGINVRKPEVSFRLGCSMELESIPTVLTLENGLTTATAGVADTICSGEDYTIKGGVPSLIKGAYTIAWFYSGDAGVWYEMKGENGRNLRLKDLRNIHTADNVLLEYRYQRRIYSPSGDAISNTATIRVINTEVKLLAVPKDTLDVNMGNTEGSILVQSNLPITIRWKFKENELTALSHEIVPNKHYNHTPAYNDFKYLEIVNTGIQPLEFHYYFYDKTNKFCQIQDTVWVNVEKSTGDTPPSDRSVCGYPFLDDRGKRYTYNTVKIGTQCWMAANLNHETGSHKCYAGIENNCTLYGRLYNWTTAMNGNTSTTGSQTIQGVCPKGWRMPTNEDWSVVNSISGPNGTDIRRQDWGGSNSKGFSAVPGGGVFFANNNGYPTYAGINSRNGDYDISSRAWWWTATSQYHYWSMIYNRGGSYNMTIMPYYITLTGNGLSQYTITSFSSYHYPNSIFSGSDYRHIESGESNSGWNSGHNINAHNHMKTDYYFSVRCVRTEALRPEEE